MADVSSPLIISGFLEGLWNDPSIYSVFSYKAEEYSAGEYKLAFAMFFTPENDMNQDWMKYVKLLWENGRITPEGQNFID